MSEALTGKRSAPWRRPRSSAWRSWSSGTSTRRRASARRAPRAPRRRGSAPIRRSASRLRGRLGRAAEARRRRRSAHQLIGLYGPSSPLPTSYTERVVHSRTPTRSATSSTSSTIASPACSTSSGDDTSTRCATRSGVRESDLARCGALFGLSPLADEATEAGASADALCRAVAMNGPLGQVAGARLLAPCFRHTVPRFEDVAPRWVEIPCRSRFALGEPRHAPRVDTLIGDRVGDALGWFRALRGTWIDSRLSSSCLIVRGGAARDN